VTSSRPSRCPAFQACQAKKKVPRHDAERRAGENLGGDLRHADSAEHRNQRNDEKQLEEVIDKQAEEAVEISFGDVEEPSHWGRISERLGNPSEDPDVWIALHPVQVLNHGDAHRKVSRPSRGEDETASCRKVKMFPPVLSSSIPLVLTLSRWSPLASRTKSQAGPC